MSEPSKDEDPKLGELKARAQGLQVLIRVGHEGVGERLINALNEALDQHELVKIKFMAHKDQKKLLARVIEQQTNSKMVQRVGHTATYYRARKEPKAE